MTMMQAPLAWAQRFSPIDDDAVPGLASSRAVSQPEAIAFVRSLLTESARNPLDNPSLEFAGKARLDADSIYSNRRRNHSLESMISFNAALYSLTRFNAYADPNFISSRIKEHYEANKLGSNINLANDVKTQVNTINELVPEELLKLKVRSVGNIIDHAIEAGELKSYNEIQNIYKKLLSENKDKNDGVYYAFTQNVLSLMDRGLLGNDYGNAVHFLLSHRKKAKLSKYIMRDLIMMIDTKAFVTGLRDECPH